MRIRKRLIVAAFGLIVSTLPAHAMPLPASVLSSSNVQLIANLPDVPAIGARILGDTMYVTTTQGLRIYDLALAGSTGVPVLVGALELPHWENEDVDTNGKILLIAVDNLVGVKTALYVIDVSIRSAPRLLSRLDVPAAHTASCINNCTYAWLGGGGGNIHVVNLTNPSAPRYAGHIPVSGTVHDVQVDDSGVAWVSTSLGLFGYRTADPVTPRYFTGSSFAFDNDFIIHNSQRPQARRWRPVRNPSTTLIAPGELLLVTEEDFLGPTNGDCREDGAFQTGRVRQAHGLLTIDRLDTFNVGKGTLGTPSQRYAGPNALCSSHYFSVNGSVASVAWYEQGVRFLDFSNPLAIRQIGYWLPVQGAAWNVLTHRGFTYVFDVVRGIDVLTFRGTAGAPAQLAPHLNPPLAGTRPSPTWGYACRLPRAV